ncbi:MAG: FAD:protein FMN transferase [Bacteroidota bacterium]
MKCYTISNTLLVSLVLLSCWACRTDPSPSQSATQTQSATVVDGKTMGTYYRVKYLDTLSRDLKKEMDELLLAINMDLSTYIPESVISKFNSSDQALVVGNLPAPLPAAAVMANEAVEHPHFLYNYLLSKDLHRRTNGAFDPSVMPLVRYWGFATEKRAVTKVDSLKVDSLRQLIGFDQFDLEWGPSAQLRKAKAGLSLDMSAVAKGYGVDEIGRLLDRKGIDNYLIDIGGEVVAKGKNEAGNWWTVGISVPDTDASPTDLAGKATLQNRALATSGNYRNYYEVEGIKYGHTIDPATGFPRQDRLLSASVFAPDCATADAFATAFMVMGLEKAYALAEAEADIEAYLIFGESDGSMGIKYTPGLEGLVR